MVKKYFNLILNVIIFTTINHLQAQIPGCIPDVARPVSATFSGTATQTYNMVPMGNVVTINLQANRRYTFSTNNADTTKDSRLTLITQNGPGADKIAHNDDGGVGLQSLLTYTSVTATTAYLYLTTWDTGLTFGCITDTILPFNIIISTQAVTIPNNNNCSGAVNLVLGANCTNGTNVNATPDLNGETVCGSPLDKSVWYKFTATSAYSKVIISNAVNIGINLSVVTDCNATNPNCATTLGNNQVVYLNSVIGTVYYIIVDGYNSDEGTFCVKVENFTPLANDNCAGAINLSVNGTYTASTNIGATPEQNHENNCGSIDDKGVWYKFTASSAYSKVIVNESSLLDAVIGVYESCADQFEFDCIDNTFDLQKEELTFATNIGTTYYVLISGYFGDLNTFNVRVETVIPPANDDCSMAKQLIMNAPFVSGTNIDANPDINVAPFNCLNLISVPAVWYQFLATSNNATVIVDTSATVDVVLSAHLSCTDTAFVCYDNDTSYYGERLSFATQPGQTYYIYVGGYSSSEVGNFNIKVIGNTVNIKEDQATKVTIYPNPAQDNITIDLSEANNIKELNIEIQSIDGKIVQENTIQNVLNKSSVDISNLTNGAYFIKINTQNSPLLYRSLIIQK